MKLALLRDRDFATFVLGIDNLSPPNAQAGLESLNNDYDQELIIESYTKSTYLIAPFSESLDTHLNTQGIRQLLIELNILEVIPRYLR
jgi:hypothetical protein